MAKRRGRPRGVAVRSTPQVKMAPARPVDGARGHGKVGRGVSRLGRSATGVARRRRLSVLRGADVREPIRVTYAPAVAGKVVQFTPFRFQGRRVVISLKHSRGRPPRLCQQRKTRKEVIFATGKGGRGGPRGPYRRTAMSRVRC
jgi:hypothetical protein